MSPQDIAFYICSALTLLCGLVVITKKDPVTSALFLVLCIVSLAGLFLLLHAFFLAAVQVLVYAGAVMVLFLFVIMLLDLKQEARRRIHAVRALLGVLSVAAVAALVLRAIWKNNPGAGLPASDLVGGTAPLGKLLFHNFILPFEILSLLLLVAMVGAILLSKKDLK
jgi:NADH-quinone oxidoreductase subunit J